jgi:hypothetical protein
MSLLPQRKKSADEIAKLREDLGIPGLAPADAPPPSDAAHVPSPSLPEPVPVKRETEQVGATSAEEISPAPSVPPKKVRSLRKSEQAPLPAQPPEPPPASNLPIHRHSEDEIMRIRRQEIFAMQNAPQVHPKLIAAHIALVIPGYLLAIGGGVGFYFYDQPIAATAACAVTALFIAAFIFFKKPLSQHHAAFISVIALFVIVFGALHYFPQLRHGS